MSRWFHPPGCRDLRSIEVILSLDPMNRFDALADPITTCFTDTLDPTPYRAVPSNIPLDERNPAGTAINQDDQFWLGKTRELDWSHIDAPDPYWLNRIIWYSLHRFSENPPSYPNLPWDNGLRNTQTDVD